MANWASLTDKQKKKFGGSKKAFKAAKKDIKKSGGSIQSAKQVVKQHKRSSPSPSPSPAPSPSPSPSPSPKRSIGTAKKVSNINAYDTTSYGSGSSKGTDKISGADIRELTKQGFSDKEVVNYVENKWRSGTKGGLKAQNLLNQYKERLTTPAPTPAAEPPKATTPAPTQGPRNAITPDMYQSSNSTKETTTEGSSNTNNVTVGGGKGKGNISINQSNSQTFKTVQDNDIVTSVTGNNNNVNNTQDNSVKNYGGNQSNNTTTGASNNTTAGTSSFGKYKGRDVFKPANYDDQINHLMKYQNLTREQAEKQNKHTISLGMDANNDGIVTDMEHLDFKDGSASDPNKDIEVSIPEQIAIPSGTDFKSGNRNTTVKQKNNQEFKTTQDNDIVTSIVGDNNNVSNYQDNSVRNYGGDQKNFTYVGGKNPLTDSPVSAATMAGYYDVDDSPAKQAKFVDMYTTMNRDNQQRRKGMTPSIANEMIAKANNLPGFDHRALDKVNRMGPQIARDRAMERQLAIFGDTFKAKTPDWNSPERQSAIEQPDYDDLYKKYTSF